MPELYKDTLGSQSVSDLRSQLIRDEGRVPHMYSDSLGFATIGVGRLIDKRRGGKLSDAEIDYLLDNDIRDKTAAVLKALPWAVDLNEPRRAVLIGMAFQLGTDGLLGFVNTLKAVREGRWADAKKGMLASKWAKQTPARVERMAKQMLTGVWQQ